MKPIKTRVVHSESKHAWNVIGCILGGKYKIASVPYHAIGDENDILHVINKHEALEHAQFISDSFNINFRGTNEPRT